MDLKKADVSSLRRERGMAPMIQACTLAWSLFNTVDTRTQIWGLRLPLEAAWSGNSTQIDRFGKSMLVENREQPVRDDIR